jgi:hypothetical protein
MTSLRGFFLDLLILSLPFELYLSAEEEEKEDSFSSSISCSGNIRFLAIAR